MRNVVYTTGASDDEASLLLFLFLFDWLERTPIRPFWVLISEAVMHVTQKFIGVDSAHVVLSSPGLTTAGFTSFVPSGDAVPVAIRS